MEPITPDTLNQVSTQLAANPSLQRMMDYLDDRQPDALSYAMLALENYRTEAGMKATMLNWMAVRAFEVQSPTPIPPISRDRLLQHAKLNEDLFQKAGKRELEDFLDVMSLETSAQPHLLDFIRKAVAEHMSKGGADEDAAREAVATYLAVKTVVDALDAATT